MEQTEDAEHGFLHAGVIDLVMQLRTIKQQDLLKYIKQAIITLYIDRIEDSERTNELRDSLASADPLPSVTLTTLSKILAQINSRLEILSFEIVESKDMDDSSVNVFSFVNKKATGAIHLSTKYTENEIQLVKHVIDRIFGPEYVMGSTSAGTEAHTHHQLKYSVPYMTMVKSLRNGPKPQENEEDARSSNRLTLDEADSFLRDLECYGWLERHDNEFTLGTRGLVELKKYLIDTYGKCPEGTISVCFGCGDILTRGLACSSDTCGVRFHPYCQDLVRKSKHDDSCPNETCGENMGAFYTF